MKGFLINLVDAIFTIYVVMIIIRAILSWFRSDIVYRFYSFFKFVINMVDPFLNFIKRLIPVNYGMIDFSPIIAIFIVEIVRSLVINLLVKIL